MVQEQMNVKGIAVREGTSRNGITYTKEELLPFSKTIKNKPILKDHESRTDNTIGKLTSGGSDDGGKTVFYEGWVKEDGTGILEKIDDGRASEVSIGAHVEKIVEEENGGLLAVGLTCMEISTTPTPGVIGTSLTQALENIGKGKTAVIAENFNIHDSGSNDSEVIEKNAEEDTKMGDEEPKVEEPVVEEPKTEEPVVEEPVVEEPAKEEPAKEEPVVEEPKAEESHKVKIEVDSSGLDEALVKAEKLSNLKNKLNEKVKKVDNTKGKIVKDDVKEEKVISDYVVEQCSYGEGASIWKNPKDDGSYL